MNPSTQERIILLVEDNPGDVRLVREALENQPRHSQLHVVADGIEALAFLRREGSQAGTRRPDLILLDLNLPRMDGRELLAELKSDPELACIPVVVFTSSDADGDVERAYGLHANCYVPKPADLDRYLAAVRAIEELWLGWAQLPLGRE